MKVKIETRYDILKTLMCEDRKEVRAIKTLLYNLLSVMTGLSFFSTPFTFTNRVDLGKIPLFIDLAIAVFIWVIFFRLRSDMKHCRQCLEARQRLILELNESTPDDVDFNPIVDARETKVTIKDRDLWLFPIVATAAILIKAIAMATV